MTMHVQKYHLYFLFLSLLSLLLSWISFEVGYYKANSTLACDPFQIIRTQTHSPYPNIQSLLKNKK